MPESLKDWAKGPRRKTQRCATCSMEGMIEIVREFLQLKIEGKSVKAVSEFHSYLQQNHNYTLSAAALGKHIRHCETELWQKTRS